MKSLSTYITLTQIVILWVEEGREDKRIFLKTKCSGPSGPAQNLFFTQEVVVLMVDFSLGKSALLLSARAHPSLLRSITTRLNERAPGGRSAVDSLARDREEGSASVGETLAIGLITAHMIQR